MSKFSVAYVKQHPAMFGVIFLVFGLGLWMLLNRNGSAPAQGGTTVVTPGPSDAQVAAGTQVQLAQLDANTQVTLAQIAAGAHNQDNDAQLNLGAMALQAQMAQIQSDHDIANSQIEASLAALTAQLGNNLAITNSNNSFMLDYAKNAQDAATSQLLIGANLQATLGAQQLDAFKFSSAVSAIPSLNKNDRDNALQALIISSSGNGGSYTGDRTGQNVYINPSNGGTPLYLN